MAVYSTNQNRQLYVVSEVTTDTPSELGQVKVNTTPDEKFAYFQFYGQGGLERSDLIPVGKISRAKITTADDLARPLKTCTVSLNEDINDGAPISGLDYILRIYIRNYIAPGDANVITKYGCVHAYSGMDAAKFYEVLAASLSANFSREVTRLLEFEATDDGVTITEVEQPWIRGTFASEPVHFEVVATTIPYEGDDVIWAETDEKGRIALEDSDTVVEDGKKIADLEFFCHGERGDQYRGIGYPNVIPTRYMVDPDEKYDVLDLHYAFKDTGYNDYRSEKDLTLVEINGAGVLSSIQSTLEGLGVTFEE